MTIDNPNKYEEAINKITETANITSYPGYLDVTMVSFKTVHVYNATNNRIKLDTSSVRLNRMDVNN